GHPTQRQQLEEITRLQIFLDNANFGPGKIDGKDGEFTRKALKAWKRSQGEENDGAEKETGPMDGRGLDLTSVNEVFTTYVITKADVEGLGEIPDDLAIRAKLKWLPYTSLAEAIAERFHCDVDFFKDLNPQTIQTLKEGDEVTVPNVKPFELDAIKALETDAQSKHGKRTRTPKENASTSNHEQKISLFLRIEEKVLEVYDGAKLIAVFPVSVGSEETSSPLGKWTVKAIALLPTFRHDQKMLKEGERSSTFHMLPPGPNNPVGVIWIALDKDGIGIHGTNDPDLVGRIPSHGCIRLANWDIVKLATLIKSGVPVVVE
ncbi:MAG TPA: L,D-transpeptidase family protein, partial [Terrimicrobiaceae bacterium]